MSLSMLFGNRPEAPALAIFLVISEACPPDSGNIAAAADCRCFAELILFLIIINPSLLHYHGHAKARPMMRTAPDALICLGWQQKMCMCHLAAACAWVLLMMFTSKMGVPCAR